MRFTLAWRKSTTTRKAMPDQVTLEEMFKQYWQDSFPMAPANKQSAASHVAFAQHVLSQIKPNLGVVTES